jgi:hypothetical protein
MEDERPPDDIVPYDLLLEDWFDELDKRKELERQKGRRGGKSNFRME